MGEGVRYGREREEKKKSKKEIDIYFICSN